MPRNNEASEAVSLIDKKDEERGNEEIKERGGSRATEWLASAEFFLCLAPCGAGGYFGSSGHRSMQGVYLGIYLDGNT